MFSLCRYVLKPVKFFGPDVCPSIIHVLLQFGSVVYCLVGQGHVFFLRVKVTWTDFVSFAFIRHFFNHNWILFKCTRICSMCVAVAGSSWVVRTAVSSGKLAVVLSAVVGKSAVSSRQRSGPSKLPCGTPDRTVGRDVYSSLYFIRKYLFSRYDFRILYILSGNNVSILYCSPSCHTLSKA